MQQDKGGNRGSQMKTTKKSKEPDSYTLKCLAEWKQHYINNVKSGVGVFCDKCNKFRHVEEYEEANEVPEFWECSMWNMGDGLTGNCFIPQLVDEDDYTDEKYTPGSIVWAKMKSYSRWPAIVGDDPDTMLYFKGEGNQRAYHVVFLGEEFFRAWIREKDISPFSKPRPNEQKYRKKRVKAVEEAMEVNKLKKDERIEFYLRAIQKNSKNANNAETKAKISGKPGAQINSSKRKIIPCEYELPVVTKKRNPPSKQPNKQAMESKFKLSRNGSAQEKNESGVVHEKRHQNKSDEKSHEGDLHSEKDADEKSKVGSENPPVEATFPVASTSTNIGVEGLFAETQPPVVPTDSNKTKGRLHSKPHKNGKLLTRQKIWKNFIHLKKKYPVLNCYNLRISPVKDDCNCGACNQCDRSDNFLTLEQLLWKYHPYFKSLKKKHPILYWFTVSQGPLLQQ